MTRKRLLSIFILVVLCISAFGFFIYKNKSAHTQRPASHQETSLEKDFKNAVYEIEGQKIKLNNGYSKASIEFSPDSMTTVETRYFGNFVTGDFDSNGTTDAVLLLTQNPGGSGTFYYVALALADQSGQLIGANTIFLGDRIAPQTTEYRDNTIIVNYADRRPDEPFSAEPTVGISRYFHVENRRLAEIQR